MQSVVSRSFFLVFLCLEALVLSISFDSQSLEKTHNLFLGLIGYAGELIRFFVAVAGGFAVFGWPRFQAISHFLLDYNDYPWWQKWLAAHGIFIMSFIYITSALFQGVEFENSHEAITVNLVAVSWFLIGIGSVVCLFFTIAPAKCWTRLISQEIALVSLAVLTGVLSWFAGEMSELDWQPLTELTFNVSGYLLGVFYPEVVIQPVHKILGTPGFEVQISPQCSGYEGIGLIIVFLFLYIIAYRRTLLFPNVYILFPIGVITIWVLNVFRIVALIAIGSSFSEEIAAGGFHSNAGWIAFVLISGGMVSICQRSKYFLVESHAVEFSHESNHSPVPALLLPFVALLSSIILTSAFTVDFNWLYPIRVIVSLSVIWYFRKQYRPIFKNITLHSLLIGFSVFVIWLILVDVSEQDNQKLMDSLFEAPPLLVSSWLLFRFIGATITVPIIEELVFRGYLINKLSDINFTELKTIKFTWLSFLGSSILFGALHGEWLAGTIAGMGFALALYHKKSISDAITAHMTTNTLLAFYVMSTGNWSLW